MSRPLCGRPTPTGACTLPRGKGIQRCRWHWLKAQSSDVQAACSRARLEKATEPHRPRVPKEEWPEGHRWCAGCQSFVPTFYASGSRCKACASMASHERRVETVYGISAERYEQIFADQGRRCAICRNEPRTIRFAVDHDHKTGAVRGILCKRCNHDLLGGAHDDIDMLFAAMAYLLYPPAERTVRPDRERVLRALREHWEAGDTRAQASAARAAEAASRLGEPPF